MKLIIIAVVMFVQVVFGHPLLKPKLLAPPSPKIPSMDAFNFMKRFGYLEEGDGDSEALYSEEAIIEAIKQVQKFGAIPQTGIADNATLNLIKSRRCGVPDIARNSRNKRFVLGSEGWKKNHITYYLSNWTPKLGEAAVAKYIQRALDTWGRYGHLSFERVNHPKADIIVVFAKGSHGDSFPFDGQGNILAHAFFPYQQPGYGGDIHFDEDEEWTVHHKWGEDGTDFFTVAIHELGHSLGLSHSPIPNSIMFPYYKGFDPELSLDQDDILGMYELYIKTPFDSPRIEYTTPSREYPGERTPRPRTRRPQVTERTHHGGGREKPSRNASDVPNICEVDFDTMATLRNELFIFKDQYIWRLKDRNIIEPSYPIQMRQMFPLPKYIKKIDAAYERPDGMIVLFTGKKYWVYDGREFLENSPQPLTNYGLPKTLSRVDAVQNWRKNGKTYLYKNDRFWRYNEKSKRMDRGYPKNMNVWGGVPHNLDAAITWKDGVTYFFKGRYFWRFDNVWVQTTDTSPLPTPQTWFGCPEQQFVREYFSRE